MADTVDSILQELEQLGSAQTKKVLARHGVREPFFGVRVGDMKPIVKRVKKNHELSMGLFATGNADAMYLAGLIADEKAITKKDLEYWLSIATSQNIIEFTIPWIASESRYGWELGLQWIDSTDPKEQGAGWTTLGNWVSLRNDSDLDIPKLRQLIARVESEIDDAANRVRYAMNMFLIAVGSYVAELTTAAKTAGQRIGAVSVEMHGTACKVPSVVDYIAKIESMGRVGKKKKQARC
jgi:hypothetical protein